MAKKKVDPPPSKERREPPQVTIYRGDEESLVDPPHGKYCACRKCLPNPSFMDLG